MPDTALLTTHALARLLLAGPDLPVAAVNHEYGTYHPITMVEERLPDLDGMYPDEATLAPRFVALT